jgi:transposase
LASSTAIGAGVSFIAGMMIDKFCYRQPPYRQHQRLRDSHIKVSRSWLTQLMQKAVAQLEPIFYAQLEPIFYAQLGSIRASRVKAMDETPIKAGLAEPGNRSAMCKKHSAYRRRKAACC